MILFLHLFEPTSGKLSKAKPQQQAFIESKISPQLTEAAYCAKVEEYGQRLDAIEEELEQYEDVDEEEVENQNVDNIEPNTQICYRRLHYNHPKRAQRALYESY